MSSATDDVEVRLRALEFLLAHLISTTRSSADLIADRDDLDGIVDRGEAWKLMPEVARGTARDVMLTVIGLLDDAKFQQGR